MSENSAENIDISKMTSPSRIREKKKSKNEEFPLQEISSSIPNTSEQSLYSKRLLEKLKDGIITKKKAIATAFEEADKRIYELT